MFLNFRRNEYCYSKIILNCTKSINIEIYQQHIYFIVQFLITYILKGTSETFHSNTTHVQNVHAASF